MSNILEALEKVSNAICAVRRMGMPRQAIKKREKEFRLHE